MASASLAKILLASRPFIPFTFTAGETELELFVRKVSQSENEVISKVWDKVYKTEFDAYISSPPGALTESLKRADANTLAQFIARADKRDLEQQAMAEMDGNYDGLDARVEELIAERKQTLLDSVPEEKMYDLALNRRAHFQAASLASDELLRTRLMLMVFGDEKEPLFGDTSEVAALPEDEYNLMVKAAGDALNPKPSEEVPDPLN